MNIPSYIHPGKVVSLVLKQIAPNARCGGPGPRSKADWAEWHWDDPRPKPTWEQIEAAWAEIEPTLPDPEVEAENEAKITAKMREIGIQQLKDEGELPPDFGDKEIGS